MVSTVAAAAVLGGCAQLAGIDSTNGDGRAGNSVALTRASIGTSVVKSPADLTGLQATYLVASSAPDGFDRVDADPAPGGNQWTSKLHEPQPVELTLPQPVDLTLPDSAARPLQLLSYDAQNLALQYPVLEHPAPQAAPDGAMFSITPLNTAVGANDLFTAYVVGAWLKRPFSATEIVPGSATIAAPAFSFVASNSLTGRPQIDLVTTQDTFLLLRYVGTALTGVAEAAAFGQVVPSTTVTTGDMTDVTTDQILQVTFNASNFAARLAAARPAPAAAAMMGWTLDASPGYALADTTGPELHGFTTIGPMDTGVNGVAYGNPFAARGWNTTLTVTASASRSYPASPPNFPLVNAMTQILEPAAGADIELSAGLPINITIDGTRLSVDGQTIAPPTKPVEVSFTTDITTAPTAPNAQIFALQMIDLLVDMTTGAPNPTIVLAMSGDTATFRIPPELFQAGHLYTLRAFSTVTPLAGLAQGDLTIRSLPFAQSYSDSAAFTVTP